MSIKNIIVGNKYNMLIPIEVVGKYGDGCLMWKCQCDCGNTTNIRSSSIGKIKSCGCLKTTSHLIVIGQKYGMLTAIEEVPRQNRWGHFFKFKCDCGNEKITSSTHVAHGKTCSCGCLHKNSTVAASKITRGEYGRSTLNMLFINAQENARRRNKEFKLSLEDYSRIIQLSCFYCGKPPHEYKTKRYYGCVFINGIDRIDSSIGYINDNVVPCCKTCNSAKGELTQSQFDEWIRCVYNHRNL